MVDCAFKYLYKSKERYYHYAVKLNIINLYVCPCRGECLQSDVVTLGIIYSGYWSGQ